MDGKKYYNARLYFFILLIIAVFIAFGIRLMQYQIVDAEEYKKMAQGGYTSTQTIQAARGEILDRYGRPLATNQVGFDVVINEAYMPKSIVNTVIQRLINLMEDQGLTWIDNLPISKTQPFIFLADTEKNQAKIKKLKEDNKINMDTDATITLENLFQSYKLDGMKDKIMARKIAGVRYEMESAGSSSFNPYTFSKNIPRDTVVKIREYSQELPGIKIRETTTRKFTNGDIAPHVVGITGPIFQEEYEERNAAIKKAIEERNPNLTENEILSLYYDQRYGYNDIIGKSGIEFSMEDDLRGENGKMQITSDRKGNVLESKVLKEAKPGNTIVLTIDKDLQRATIEACNLFLSKTTKQYPIDKGGSANKISTVAIDVKTGEVLALVNFPGYNLEDYYSKYEELSTDPLRPLFNNATMGTYMPGSVFKPVVAIGGYASNNIKDDTKFNCTRVFTRFTDYQPTCMGLHGSIDVRNALKVSCNFFFYEAGLLEDIDTIEKYSYQLGLGVKPEIEIAASNGRFSSKSFFEEARSEEGVKWTQGNVLQASIGQLDSSFSPLQLAVYTATLASQGTRLKPHLVKSIESYNFEETVKKIEPVVQQEVEAPAQAFSAVRDGMLAASRDLGSGTARSYFGNYPIDVASKTGTPQATGIDDNATFIAYAPAHNPEIAVSVVVEKGYSGQRGAPIAKAIFDQYFGFQTVSQVPTTSGQLLP